MYAQYFGLKQDPFSIAPDPRYLFMSERHREALAHLLYGLGGGGGFVLLSGEIGAGKTTVCRCFLEQIPRRCNVAYIFNPKLTVIELLKTVCDEFGIPVEHKGPGPATVKDYTDPLNEFLLKTHSVGQSSILIIDEAQNLSPDVLEQLRLLTNLETSERKLLQIILIGQPELRHMLARPELEQLAQRVIARYHLEALSEAETAQYIRHRLAVAGMTRAIPFDARALQRIHQLSRGVPRRINLLCDRALLGAYASGRTDVDAGILDKAAAEVFDRPPSSRQQRARRRAMQRTTAAVALGVATGAALVGVLALGVGRDILQVPSRETGEPQAALAASTPGAPKAVPASASAPSRAASPAAASAPADATPLRVRLAGLPRHEPEAWRALAPLWKLDVAGDDPCLAAQQRQVLCWRAPATNLALIRSLGRPGILTLQAEDGPAYAVLTGLSDDTATLHIDGQPQSVALGALAQVWRGDFATYWRVPPGYLNRVGEGAGPLGQWLTERLAAVPGAPDDAPLRQRIHAFQLAQGLEPDGLAGPMTFMQLNRASGVDEPRLQTGK